jgi:uncharacterized Zn finger protein
MITMPASDLEILKKQLRTHWSGDPGDKARRYIGCFFNQVRMGSKISAQVEGNYGTYTVSIQAAEQSLSSACSCYIGKHGFCHHCAALAATYLSDPGAFREIVPRKRDDVHDLAGLREYLGCTTLEALIRDLKEHGVTQKAFSESIGMNPRRLASIKSSELRNRFYNELGATKLACLWVLEHLTDS